MYAKTSILTHRIVLFCRHILGNGSLYFSKIQAAGPSPDPGRYRCIAEVAIMGVGSVKTVHRIATPPIKLEIARKSDCIRWTGTKCHGFPRHAFSIK